MGVKSTVTLTRAAAEMRFLDLFVQVRVARREKEMRIRLEHLRTEGTLDKTDELSHLQVSDATIRDICVAVDALKRRYKNERKARMALEGMDDARLEKKLARLNDEANGGEGFDNFLIEG